MKVYLVWDQYGDWDPIHLVGVYASKETAEQVVRERNDPEDPHYSCWLQEKEVIQG